MQINKEVKVKHSAQLSVVSYNLLAQDLIQKNMHLYTHCSNADLAWDYRKDNLLKDLAQSSADVSSEGRRREGGREGGGRGEGRGGEREGEGGEVRGGLLQEQPPQRPHPILW